MNNNRLLTLLTKYQDNTCTQDELRELEQWYALLNTGNQSIEDGKAEFVSDQMLMQLRKMVEDKAPVIPFYRRAYFRIAVAASIIIMLSTGVYFQFFNNAKQNHIAKTNGTVPHDITAPTATKAMIILADGRTVALDSVTSGTLAMQGNVNVVKTTDGQIVYNGSSTKVEYNTMFNPRGSKVVNLTLSDGTKVWLNSESSLRYPTAFAGIERGVEVTGEAYFEVAKDAAKKFIVSGNGVITEVLGTHFNVNTYTDESSIRVTLLEGSVKVAKGDLTGLLKPGQQAQVSSEVKVVSGVDVDEVMAWKNGRFEFKNTALVLIMRQLQRWYDVEVVYQADVANETFTGGVPRQENASQVLKMLELTGTVHFRIEGKKVIVTK